MSLWPIAKFPLLRDDARDRTVPESTILLEYVDRLSDGPRRLQSRTCLPAIAGATCDAVLLEWFETVDKLGERPVPLSAQLFALKAWESAPTEAEPQVIDER